MWQKHTLEENGACHFLLYYAREFMREIYVAMSRNSIKSSFKPRFETWLRQRSVRAFGFRRKWLTRKRETAASALPTTSREADVIPPLMLLQIFRCFPRRQPRQAAWSRIVVRRMSAYFCNYCLNFCYDQNVHFGFEYNSWLNNATRSRGK